jgi:hypothetical protein
LSLTWFLEMVVSLTSGVKEGTVTRWNCLWLWLTPEAVGENAQFQVRNHVDSTSRVSRSRRSDQSSSLS